MKLSLSSSASANCATSYTAEQDLHRLEVHTSTHDQVASASSRPDNYCGLPKPYRNYSSASELELPPGTRATFQLRTSSYFDSGDTVDSGFGAGLIGTSSLSGSWEQFTLSISENFYMLINCTSTTNQVIPITPPK